ncbi:hypothetical protein CMO89_03790 [Candidatus Woesearchaeota archaeon]|nr:hypothetical protein [Candidatus Woesearchaeota archaeon]|tara:strand:+ start:23202 stop:23816 length:615 start_codon:yes stop_codon:yes gene_type:complete
MVDLKHTFSDRIFLPAARFRIKHRDYFHLKLLYRMMYHWLVEEGLVSRSSVDFPETYYLNREKPKKGDEVMIWWRIKKEVDKYYRYIINVNFKVIYLRKTEVMHQGQKFDTNWGEVEIIVESRLEMDWQHECGTGWRDHPFLKNFNELFHKRIFKKELESFKLELYRYSYRFQEAIKTYLQRPVYLPEGEKGTLWPELGLGDTK